jgi:hypothetical protein
MITIRSTLGLDVFELDNSNTISDLKKKYIEIYKHLINPAIHVYNFERELQEDSDHIIDDSFYFIFIRPIPCHHH